MAIELVIGNRVKIFFSTYDQHGIEGAFGTIIKKGVQRYDWIVRVEFPASQTDDLGFNSDELELVEDEAPVPVLAPSVRPSLVETIAELNAEIEVLKAEAKFTSDEHCERLNEFWGLVYPDDPTSWDYAAQVYRHVSDYINELKTGKGIKP